jgi:hypothetical protein
MQPILFGFRARTIGFLECCASMTDALHFEYPEDERYFHELLCQVGESSATYYQLFDFRRVSEKRRDFQRVRDTHLRLLEERFGRTCLLRCAPDCDPRSGLTVDHVIPLSSNKLAKALRGLRARRSSDGNLQKVRSQSFGSNHPRNLVLACCNCNSFKQNRILRRDEIRQILQRMICAGVVQPRP